MPDAARLALLQQRLCRPRRKRYCRSGVGYACRRSAVMDGWRSRLRLVHGSGRRQDCPDGLSGIIRPDAPPAREVLHDVQAPATERRNARVCPSRGRRCTAVADRHLNRVVAECPRDLNVRTREWPGVPDGVAEKLAHDENRVADGRLEEPGSAQVGSDPLAGDSDARRCPGQQYRPRRSHLPRSSDPSPRGPHGPVAAEMPGLAPAKPTVCRPAAPMALRASGQPTARG